MKKLVMLAILEAVIILNTCGCHDKSDKNEQEMSTSESLEYLEVIQYGEYVEGLDNENEYNIMGKITDMTEESINIKRCRFVIDETAPSGCYIIETNEEIKLAVADNIQVWIMQSGQFIDSRIAYADIKNYENLEGHSVFWGFNFDDDGKVKFIYQLLIP